MKPKMARKPRPIDEVSSPPLSPTSGRLMHKKRRLQSNSVSPDRKMSTSSYASEKGSKPPHSPKFSPPKELMERKESKVPKPMSPLPPLILDDNQPCTSNGPVTAVQAPPEFLTFDYNFHCPTLRGVLKADECLPNIKSEVLRELQHELESMLAHTMDFMRRAAGDLQFLDTGEYPNMNLKKREMPVYTLRILPSPMSPTTQIHHEISLRSLVVPPIAPDDDVDVWPPPHMGRRYQSYKIIERQEMMIDKATLHDFEEFMFSEMNELDVFDEDVYVPEFNNRLQYTSSLEMFYQFERRLHHHSLQLQQVQIVDGARRVIHPSCGLNSLWWTHPVVPLGAAESFVKTFRLKYNYYVSERRIRMMKITQLPSLRYRSVEEKEAVRREHLLKEENKKLKKQLEETKKSLEKEEKEKNELKRRNVKKLGMKEAAAIIKEDQKNESKKKVPSTPSKAVIKKPDASPQKWTSSKIPSSFKPITLCKMTPSTSTSDELNADEKLMKKRTGGARFVMVAQDADGKRRVIPLTDKGEWKAPMIDPYKEKRYTLHGGDLKKEIRITVPAITNRFARIDAYEECVNEIKRANEHYRKRAKSLANLRKNLIEAGRSSSAPPPPLAKITNEMMRNAAMEIADRYGLPRSGLSFRVLTSKEANKEDMEMEVKTAIKKTVKKPIPCKKTSNVLPIPSKKQPLPCHPRKTSPIKKICLKTPSTPITTPKNTQPKQPLTQMERIQQRHQKAVSTTTKMRPSRSPQKPAIKEITLVKPPPVVTLSTTSKPASTPRTPQSTSASKQLRSPPVPSSPAKPTVTLPKSPIPSPTTTISSSSAPIPTSTTRTSARKQQKASEEPAVITIEASPAAPSPLQLNGIENGVEPVQTQRRSTRDRKPSLKIQQSQLPMLHHYASSSSSRKNSKVPDPTPEPEIFVIPQEPKIPNGIPIVSPMKEDMPILSPVISPAPIKLTTRRQTRNSLDAAAPPPELQVEQVLRLEAKMQQFPPNLSPIKTTPVTRSRRGTMTMEDTVTTPTETIVTPKETAVTPKDVTPKKKDTVITSKDTVVTPKSTVVTPKVVSTVASTSITSTPKRTPNGLTSPITRRRASLEEKKKIEEDDHDEIMFVKEVHAPVKKPPTVSKKIPVKITKNENVAKKKKNKKKKVVIVVPKKKKKEVRKKWTPIPTYYLCLTKMEEMRKAGKGKLLKRFLRWITGRAIVKFRFSIPQTVQSKRERRIEILKNILGRIITPSPTRYMLSEEEKEKMKKQMGKKVGEKISPEQIKLEKEKIARKKRLEMNRELNAKRWVSETWYNMQMAKRRILWHMKRDETRDVTVLTKPIEGTNKVKLYVLDRRELRIKKKRKEVKRIDGWKKILKKKVTKRLREEKKKEGIEKKEKKTEKKMKKKVSTASPSKSMVSPNEKKSAKIVEEKKKIVVPSTVSFKGKIPKLIKKDEQWKEFLTMDGKPLGPPTIIEAVKTGNKKSSNSPVKNGQKGKKKNAKTKKLKKEEEVEEVVIKIRKIKDLKKTKEKASSKKTSKEEKKKKESKLSWEEVRLRYITPAEEVIAEIEKEKRAKSMRHLVKIIRLALQEPNLRDRQMKVLRALARHQKRAEQKNAPLIPAIDMCIPPLNDDNRPGAGKPVEWTIPRGLRAPGVYTRRKIRAVRRAEIRRERIRIEKERRKILARIAAGYRPLRRMPWIKPPRRITEEGYVDVLKSIPKACALKENNKAATAINELQWTARAKVMDVIFDTVFNGDKIHHDKDEIDTDLLEIEKEVEKMIVKEKSSPTKNENKKEVKIEEKKVEKKAIVQQPIKKKKVSIKEETPVSEEEENEEEEEEENQEDEEESDEMSDELGVKDEEGEGVENEDGEGVEDEEDEEEENEDEDEVENEEEEEENEDEEDEENEDEEEDEDEEDEEEEEEEEDDEIDVTTVDGEENMDGGISSPTKTPLSRFIKNEVAIELAVSYREYQRELDEYAKMLQEIHYIMGAREQQIQLRKNLEEKEDALAHLHAKFYREVPRRLPNETEMEQLAKALSDRREAMEEAFGANLWKQPKVQPDHPAWLTADYRPGARRAEKYNYFIDWDYDQKRVIMEAHEKMWCTGTSHHLPSDEAYGKYNVGIDREMNGEEKTLHEWEKQLIGKWFGYRRRMQRTVINPHKPRMGGLPKRPPTEASIKRKAEIEKKQKEDQEREEKEEMEEEERREAEKDVYAFDSEDDGGKKGSKVKDDWEEKEELARKWSMEENVEDKSTPPLNPVDVVPTIEKKKARIKRYMRWKTIGEKSRRIKIAPDDFADDEEEEEEEITAMMRFGHTSSEESTTLTGTLSVKEEEEDGNEEGEVIKIKKVKKERKVSYDDDGDKKVDRRKVGGLDLPSNISHLDPMVFLKLIPDNRSHKKGQGKKAMLKQIMLDYVKKAAKTEKTGGAPLLPTKPQCTQQQLMSPGGTTVIGTVPAEPAPTRRSIISPQTPEKTRERSNSIKDRSILKSPKEEKKTKKKKEVVKVKEEIITPVVTPVKPKKESRSIVSPPSSPVKAYGARRACTKNARKMSDYVEEDDAALKVPYTPASRRGQVVLAPPPPPPPRSRPSLSSTRSPSVQSSLLAPLSPLGMRSCRKKAPVKYDVDDDEPFHITTRKTTRKLTKRITIKEEIIDDDYP